MTQTPAQEAYALLAAAMLVTITVDFHDNDVVAFKVDNDGYEIMGGVPNVAICAFVLSKVRLAARGVRVYISTEHAELVLVVSEDRRAFELANAISMELLTLQIPAVSSNGAYTISAAKLVHALRTGTPLPEPKSLPIVHEAVPTHFLPLVIQ